MDLYTQYLLPEPKTKDNYQYTSVLKRKQNLPQKAHKPKMPDISAMPKVTKLPEQPQAADPRGKDLVMKSTQTCLKHTQPNSPKYKISGGLGPHRVFRFRTPSDVLLPTMPAWVHATGSKCNLKGASGDHLQYETSYCEKEISDGDAMIADLLKKQAKIKNVSALESAREHCRQAKELFYAKYGDKLEPEKTKVETKDEAINTDSMFSGHSTTSFKCTITGKDANHLRRAIHTQIQLQEQFYQSMNKSNDPPQLLQSTLPATISCRTFDFDVGGADSKVEQDLTTLSAKSMMSATVIAPILRRIQRQHLNNLNEHMSIIDDLEQAPEKVDKIYTKFKHQLSQTL